MSCPALAFDCGGPRFLPGNPAINLRHVLCGELRNGQPDGYHATLIARTPWVLGVRDMRPMRGGHGVRTGTVVFLTGQTKTSTFYPETCGEDQILASIRYAIAQRKRPKPDGSGFVAPSAPYSPSENAGYCVGDDGHPFAIRYSLLPRGDVNTAFPDEP